MSDIRKFKVLATEDRFVGLDTDYSSALYAYGDGSGTEDQGLTWYMVDRDVSRWNTDDLKHLFMSFGLSRERDLDENEINDLFGAIDWYDADIMLIATIPQSGCGTYIDGNTVRLRVPTGTTSGDYVEFFGTSFAGEYDERTTYEVARPYDYSVYGGVSSYLMPDSTGPNSIGKGSRPTEMPYTGTINEVVHPNAGLSSWTGANVDGKVFFPHLRATHFTRNPDEGNGDVVYGICFLEKGIFVLFDDRYAVRDSRGFLTNNVVSSGIWAASSASFAARTVSGGTNEQSNTDNRRAVIFTGSAAEENARLFYRTVTESYKFVYFCHAGQNEFNTTANHTYDQRKALFRPDEADDIYITEVALVDDNNVVMAYGKLSEPVVKNTLETLTLKVEINIGAEQ